MNQQQFPKDAVAFIYCRVSSQRQVNEGDGLRSQESRCRELAKQKYLPVKEVFSDKAISGAVLDRPEMQRMLQRIENSKEPVVVIIDDIKRLARDTQVHLALRAAIRVRGAKLISTTMHLGDEPEDEFIETVLAGAAALERRQNAKQVKNRMAARLSNGYWVWSKPPIGYQYTKHPLHGKVITPQAGIAEIIKEALEGFANDRFLNQVEVQEFLNGNITFRETHKTAVRLDTIGKLLQNIAYTGYVKKDDWNVPLTKAYHEPLISMAVHQHIVDKIAGKRTFTTRNDQNEDFPLRGMLICGCCKKPLTASWSKGKNARYPYYHCKTAGNRNEARCEMYGKGLKREEVHENLTALLKQLSPSEQVLNLTKVMVKDIHKQKVNGLASKKKSFAAEIATLEAQESALLSDYVRAGNPAIKKALESEIERQQFQRELLKQKLSIANDINVDLDEDVGTLMKFLKNSLGIWNSGSLESKKAAFNLIFGKQLPYSKTEGFGTPSYSLPFRVLGLSCADKNVMVDPRGFEPLTA